MDTQSVKNVLREEEGGYNVMEDLDAIAEILFNTIMDDFYARVKPYGGKAKRLDVQKQIFDACHETYERFKNKKSEKFSKWLGDFMAYLHDDFITNQVIYKQIWRK